MKNHITGKANITIEATITEVWDALTKPEIIKQYFFGTDTITDWKPGNPIKFKGEWEGKSYEDKGTVLNFEPYKLLRYDYWSSMSGIEDKPENYVTITFRLSEEDEHTTYLSIMQENIPTEEMRDHSEGNWRMVLNNLKKLLEKQEA